MPLTIDTTEILGWMEHAGGIARQYFKEVVGQRKQDKTWVTQADLDIERYFVARLHERFPDHGILGEETGVGGGSAGAIWAIDPIDGTQSFLQGLPGWSISLGLIEDGRPTHGFVYIPASDDYYWTDEAGRAICNGKPIRVRTSATLDRSDWVALTSRSHLTYQISFPGKVRGFGSIATHLCYVARDVAVAALLGGEGRGGLWDIAAGLAILRAAGGEVFTFDGQPIAIDGLSGADSIEAPMIAASPAVIETLLGYIKPFARS